MPPRKIVVRDETYHWALTPSDDGLRVVIRGASRGGGKLFAWFSHAVLVTPYVVRLAIERGLDEGWFPYSKADAAVRFDEPIPDRSVDVPPQPPLDPIEQALLDRIAESNDRADRMVYADWLLERGDPQGELIAMFAAGRRLTDDEARRTGELETSAKSWLGPVARVALRPTWAHGMLDTATLGRAASGVVDAALGHRAWRTLRVLDARSGYLALSDAVRLVTQPVLRNLRKLVASLPLALELSQTPFELPRLTHFAATTGRGKPTPAMIAALCARLPALEQLVLPALPAPLFQGLLGAITTRSLVLHQPTGLRHARRLGDHRLEELVCCPWWESFDKPGIALVVRRGPDGAWSSLTLDGISAVYAPQEVLLQALGELAPDSLIEIRCDRTKPPFDDRRVMARIEAALATQPRARPS